MGVAIVLAFCFIGPVVATDAGPAGAAYIIKNQDDSLQNFDFFARADAWVDSGGRLHTAWLDHDLEQSLRVIRLRLSRELPNGSDDPSFGTNGERIIDLDIPEPPTLAHATIVEEIGFAPDGTVIVAMLSTVGSETHASDRLLIDRYAASGARLSRVTSAVPVGTYCTAIFTSDAAPCQGDEDDGRFPTLFTHPTINILDNGVVAISSYAKHTPGAASNGVAFYNATSGAKLYQLTLPAGHEPLRRRGVQANGATSAVVNTTGGSAYLVSDWSTTSSRPLAASCRLWAGSAGGTIRTCPGLTVTVFDAAGTSQWSRTIDGPTPSTFTPIPSDGGAVMGMGWACNPWYCRWTAFRFGPTGDVNTLGLGSATEEDSHLAFPSAAPGGGFAYALEWDARSVGPSQILSGIARPQPTTSAPGAPNAPSVVGGDRQVRVSWSPPVSDGGSPVTGYRITPHRNGVAQTPIVVGNVTTRLITGLDNGVTYRFTVAAINTVGPGPESQTSPNVVPGALPAAPTNVRATAQRGQATVTWTPPPAIPGLPVTGYSMIVIADGVRLQAIDIGTGTTEIVPTLRAGVLYRFEIAARNAVGTGPFSAPSNTVTPPSPPFTSHDAATTRLSGEILGRTPTTAERTTWTGQMESGAKTPGALVADMRTRPESTTKVNPAARLYTAYFLRRPDASGLNYWITQLRAGRSNRWVAEFFARSAEFQQRYGTLTNRQFVELIYTNILGRPGEASGVDYWTGRLDTGANTRGWVMVGFSESAEYKLAQASEVEVAVLYTLLLGRAPSTDEYTADVTALDTRALTVATLAQRLITTNEYANRTTP